MPAFGIDGVAIFDSGTNQNVVAGNFIGTAKTGFLKEGNKGRGVAIYNGAQKNPIGVGGGAKDPSTETNVISNNGDDGVAIFGTAADGTVAPKEHQDSVLPTAKAVLVEGRAVSESGRERGEGGPGRHRTRVGRQLAEREEEVPFGTRE